ncbi:MULTISPECIES: hypothetical protein [unclassified Brenneria]|uniref:hypothetical protein n=1 Tax=unclassified Brenneria TaxID=2634434 RepID=UPI0015520CDE|nr:MULTISPECIES: hypothetical protein [unclassified Brenneria]MBJ7223270.1 hypothetical protein [Brenneria sp. L3-3C-1]MEE3644510.1 hypothetical protein [Brenneria sp. L3_3C_1]MEE3652071.1 hypothetical protein [Brenneria sp. HEZEL_4_2_4]NPD02032.1 hypothetical protein [Brenneria sp. hezel4-2-4]
MVSINKFSITTLTNEISNTSSSAIKNQVSSDSVQSEQNKSTNTTSTKVSSFAQQLSDAATRAEKRDASLSRSELKTKAESILKEITDANYYTDSYKKIYDAEIPDTTDPDLLARAKQATDYLNGKASNPFKGMSREQLALITYDDSGAFTVNERRAAWSESYDQEQAWREKIVAKMEAEYNRTGKITKSLSDILEHYQSLPAIEQAQYPTGYEARLQSVIASDSSSLTTNSTSLFSTLNNWKNELQEKNSHLVPMSLFTLLANDNKK